MNKRIAALFLALILCFAGVCACAQSVAVTDMAGRTFDIEQPVTRVVALAAADCEILCALGCEDALIPRGAYCDFPASVLEIPAVNSGSELNLEQIVALAPQVLIASEMDQTKEQMAALEAAGIPVLVSWADDIEGVYGAIAMIGEAMGKDEAAAALVASMKERFKEVAAQTGDTGKTVYFEVSPLEWGLWTAGANTFMDELAGICGLKNAFADVSGWAEISQEQVLARDPDYIVTIAMYAGEGPSPEDEIKSRAGWENLKAVKNGNVVRLDGDEISRPGPRLVNAARALAAFVTK